MNRWKLSLHEAGRAVAAYVLTNHKVVAKVFQDGCSCWPSQELTPASREIVSAIGPLSAALAESELEPALPLHLRNKLVQLEAVGQIEPFDHLLTDLRAATELSLCPELRMDGPEDWSDRWSERREWATPLAEQLISQHQALIVKAARELFLHGAVVIPLTERTKS